METIGLVTSCILNLILMLYLVNIKNKNQLQKIFIVDNVLIFFWCLLLLAQKYLCASNNIEPIVFEWFIYICACFLPVSILFTGIIFANTKIKFNKWHSLLFVIPILSLVILWTNDLHHLFYVNYSTDIDKTVFGSYFSIHSIYTYALYFIGLFLILRYSIKNSGIFSRQAILFILAALLPIVVNLLGIFKLIPMSIYLTPICFAFSVLLWTISIIKFKFLSVTPIALQRIVDRISDSYIVLNENDVITDFNETFLTTFNLHSIDVRNISIFDLLSSRNENLVNEELLKDALNEVKNSSKTLYFEKEFKTFNKYFHIEINTIISKGNFLGTLILLKDTTQHIQDMKTIQDNQQMLMERERLASLGQLIGGIAHNLKTPIMSISGAVEGLTDLVKEYDSSVGDSDVTPEDHHAIAKDMFDWIEKVKSYTEYMSDVITAVKGQAVTLSEEQNSEFDIEELVKRVNILMRHELKNALVTLNFSIHVGSDTVLYGNVNSLVQVINNMISNAIQAYHGEANKEIDLVVERKNDSVIISIQDYAGGLPKEVQNKLFKEMITTKGKNGTGLGLFMSYSTIRAHFNGNITFETEKDKGTRFNIILPVKQ